MIHTVGPVWHGGTHGERELLTACYRHSLELAEANGCESVAFPMISAGAYGYPRDQAMAVAVETITGFLLDHELMVYLVVFGPSEFATGKKLFRDVQEYIDDVYAERHTRPNLEQSSRRLWRENESAALDLDMEISQSISEEAFIGSAAPKPSPKPDAPEPTAAPDWSKLLDKTDKGFSETLLRLIDEKGMKDSDCYKKANVDRKLFSKIRSNPAYRPSKPTACAFAVALGLTLPETRELLNRAGFSLTHSSRFDIILEYCIKHRIHDVYAINEVLFEYDLPLLGSGMN